MPLSFEEYRAALIDSQLLSEDELGEFLSSLPADRALSNGKQLAKELVRRNLLTPHQAQTIYDGNGKSLLMGNYVVLDKLGQGGMGTVLKAQHRHMKRLVALKIMSSTSLKDTAAVNRFHREVKAVARLSHPNIVAAFDADEVRGIHYLVMEFVDGNDLSQMVKKTGPSPIDSAVHCILQAARGLEYAHRLGVIHRDIKPSNLLLDHKGQIKILDMGLARIEDAGDDQASLSELTATGAVMGTVDYMSPEQAMNTKDADARSDIYSLGCTLHYLLTGQPVYAGATLMIRLVAHREYPIPSLKTCRGDVPESLDYIFHKMVAKRREDRYQSMTELIDDLEKCQRGEAIAQLAPASSSEDSRLDNFLSELGGAKPADGSAHPLAQRGIIAPPLPQHVAAVGQDATMGAGHPQQDTDHHARINPRNVRSPSAKSERHLNWWKSRNAQIAVGAAVALIALGLLLLSSSPRRDAQQTDNVSRRDDGKKTEKPVVTWTDLPPGAPPPAAAPFNAQEAKAHQVAWGKFLGLPVEYKNDAGLTFSLIPPGEFDMGSTDQEISTVMPQASDNGEGWEKNYIITEIPRHRVRITKPFYIGAHEVTYGAFYRFTQEQASNSKYPRDINKANYPIGRVSMDMIDDYCEWLEQHDGYRYRLPTEAEWEYACRAGTETPFSCGDGISSSQANFNGKYPFGVGHVGLDRRAPTIVGTFKPNPFGLYDVHGNHWELCSDLFDASYYRVSPKDNPPGPDFGNSHVIRGGDFEHSRGYTLRSAMRYTLRIPQNTVGFRLVREVEEPKSPRERTPIVRQSIEWTSLINSNDFSDWEIVGDHGWTIANNKVITGRKSNPDASGWLMTREEFESYELELEYQLSPGCDTGVYPRVLPDADPTGNDLLEVQLLNDDDPEFVDLEVKRKHGALFDVAAPMTSPSIRTKKNEWNKVHIFVHENEIEVRINGKLTVDLTLDEIPAKGRIGLQLSDKPVDFRNFRIKKFDIP